MGLPATGNPNPRSDQAQPKRPQVVRPQQPRASAKKLKPILGYSETGVHSWRSANDQVFTAAADKFNKERGLKPGDPKYVDPQFVKAWAMVESGSNSNKKEFLTDPLQVNNSGDFNDPKFRVTGLLKHQNMTPAVSAEAALKWLEFNGYVRDKSGKSGPWLGYGRALQKYNAKKTVRPDGVRQDVWYTREVRRLYTAAAISR